MKKRGKLGQAGLACQVDGLFTHAAGHLLDLRHVDGSASQNDLRTSLANQVIYQRGPVGNGPAFGLPVV